MNKRFAVVPAAKKRVAVAVAATVGAIGSANAALPTGVTDALAAIGTDASTLATTVLLAVVAVFAIKFLRKGL